MNSDSVALSFELDADLFWLGIDPTASDRPKTLSIGRYAITRGVDRVLAVLESHRIRTTWFVPGRIAEREPEAIRKLIEAGHEVEGRAWGPGALGGRSYEDQRAEIERGLDALEAVSRIRPTGFRAPAGEVDENTFRALDDLGIAWSSCLRSAEAPRRVEIDGAPTVLDIGTRWELTDYVHFQFNYDPAYPMGQSRIASYSGVLQEWIADARATTALGLPCVFTFAPEVIGKPGRSLILRRMLDELTESGTRFATLGELAHCSRVDEGATV